MSFCCHCYVETWLYFNSKYQYGVLYARQIVFVVVPGPKIGVQCTRLILAIFLHVPGSKVDAYYYCRE